MFSNKKAITAIVSIVLLLLVSIVAFIYVQNWFISYKSEIEVDVKAKDISKSLKIIKIESTDLILKNDFGDNLNITSIKISNKECSDVKSQIDKGIATINIGSCTSGLETMTPYTVAIFTDKGVYSSVELLRAPVEGPLVVRFIIGSSCGSLGSNYYRLYGLTGLENAHADIDATSTYSVCIRHLDYEIGLSGYLNTINMFYLTQVNNSAIWTSQGSIYEAPGQWHNIAISSDRTVSFKVNSSSMTSLGYSCIGRIDEDNVYGSHIGNCQSAHSDGLWLKIS